MMDDIPAAASAVVDAITSRRLQRRLEGGTFVNSVPEFLSLLKEGSHFMLERVIHEHHFMTGDIIIDKDGVDQIQYAEFNIFEFNSPKRHMMPNDASILVRRVTIEMNNSEWTITEFGNEEKAKEDTLDFNIKKGWLVHVMRDNYPETFAERREAVEKARSCKDKLKGTYNLFTNNCEHLVSYWLTGEGYSIQAGNELKQKYRSQLQPLPYLDLTTKRSLWKRRKPQKEANVVRALDWWPVFLLEFSLADGRKVNSAESLGSVSK